VVLVLVLVVLVGRRSGLLLLVRHGHRARVDLQRVEQRVQVLRLSAARGACRRRRRRS
jgi:hypothetical protein